MIPAKLHRYESLHRMPAESKARVRFLQSFAVFVGLVSLVYLVWKMQILLHMHGVWIGYSSWIIEAWLLFVFSLNVFSLWDLRDSEPSDKLLFHAPGKVAVMIATYNENLDILLPVIAASVDMNIEHETWVLDDGKRPEVRKLAERLGARYLTREKNTHGKAGNLNHGLSHTDAEFVLFLDADHVPRKDFLQRTLPDLLSDPKLAAVQTPQDYYNIDSFEHERPWERWLRRQRCGVWHEQAIFNRAMQSGKSHWGAPIWSGTGGLFRVAAIKDIGGISVGTYTEDFHTSVILANHGWRIKYRNEVLARGLGVENAEFFEKQKYRWGAGAMQILKIVGNPFRLRGCTFVQKLCFFDMWVFWFSFWRPLFCYLLPPITAFAWAKFDTHMLHQLIVASSIVLLLQIIALALLHRGHFNLLLTLVLEAVRVRSAIAAMGILIHNRHPSFLVTPKGRNGDVRRRVRPAYMLTFLLVLNVIGFIIFGTHIHNSPRDPLSEWWFFSGFWALFNTVVLLGAVLRVTSKRFASERRNAPHFTIEAEAKLANAKCKIIDIAVGGMRLKIDRPLALRVGQREELRFTFGKMDFCLNIEVRWIANGQFGVRFLSDQEDEQARLCLWIFNGQSSAWPSRVPVGEEIRLGVQPSFAFAAASGFSPRA